VIAKKISAFVPQEHQIGMRPDKRENKSKNKKQTNQSTPPPPDTQALGKGPVNFIGSCIHFSLVLFTEIR